MGRSSGDPLSYSHENAAWCKRLRPVLKVKANVDTLQPWHDTELKAGDRWDEEIQTELERLHIFLCLSYQFLASDYIQDVELPIAKARHENGEIEVVPVVLYPMDLKHDCEFLHQLDPLPEWGKNWRDFERAATGMTRFIPSAMASSRPSRKQGTGESYRGRGDKVGLYLFSIGPTDSLANLGNAAHDAILVVAFQ
jgi:hypothetical protein